MTCPPRSIRATLATLLVAGTVAASPPEDVASAPGRWWKGNTHTHTLWSDGDGAPESVAEWYRSHGYHFLVLSDHDVLSTGERWFPVSSAERSRLTPARVQAMRERFGDGWVIERDHAGVREMRLKTLSELRTRFEAPGVFIFVQGEEISDGFQRKPVHVNGLNLAERIAPQGGGSVHETIQRNVDAVIEQGRRLGRPTLAHVNHPNFGWAITAEDLAAVKGERFFEVYNGHPAVRNEGDQTHPSASRQWDLALTRRLTRLGLGPLYGLATDDAHAYHATGVGHANPGRGWVVVRAETLEPATIIGALRAGEFYASSGVTLRDVGHDAERYFVAIEPEPGVTFTTRFIGTRQTGDGYGPIGEVLAETPGGDVEYRFRGDELYVRGEIISSRAHPNPYAEGDRERAWLQPVLRPRSTPENAVTLLDGRDLDRWMHVGSGAPCSWIATDGALTVRPGSGSIRTRDRYQDFLLSVEFRVPVLPATRKGQARGNSGVYLQKRYEVQILDSWDRVTSSRDCGALYGRVPPRVNASRPPGEWQHYLIDFTGARFDDAGERIRPARITVHHNGVLIHDDVALEGKTGAGAPEGPEPGPIVLQDHGDAVSFRNVWILPR